MRGWVTTLSVLLMVLWGSYAVPADAAAPSVSSTELITHGKHFNGMAIIYTGQVVGPPIQHGASDWINVTDGSFALGVLIPQKDLSTIRRFGNYWQVGTEVKVFGVFHNADPRAGGETDIRAEKIVAIAPGHPVRHPTPDWLEILTPITASCALLLFWLDRRIKRRGRIL